MAPNVPLLPYFVGYNGKAIQMSDKIDAVEQAEKLISEIADALQFPYKTSEATLEKYIILKNLLRTMSYKQLTELENRVLRNNEGQDERYNNVWSLFRDVIAQVGTGPALLTIQNWIKTRKVEGIQAARLISQIPKNVRQPTAEYVKAFYVSICLRNNVLMSKHLLILRI